MKAFLSFCAAVVLCAFVQAPAIAAEAGSPAPQDSAHAQNERLTQEQRAQLEQIRAKASPVLAEKYKAWRGAVRAYRKAEAEGQESKAAKARAVRAYEAVLDAEAPFRRELREAGLPVNARLVRRAANRADRP